MTGVLVHLMRHGAPAVPGLLLGHRDDAALPSGTALCVDRAADLEFGQIVSSDLIRALEPAGRIAAARGIRHEVDPRWRELDFGAWTGLASAAIAPDAYARFWEDPENEAPPEGERWSQLRRRVDQALSELDGPRLVLTHAGAMRAALSVLFHMEHRQVWAFDLPYGSVLSLKIWPGEAAQIVGLRT